MQMSASNTRTGAGSFGGETAEQCLPTQKSIKEENIMLTAPLVAILGGFIIGLCVERIVKILRQPKTTSTNAK